MNCDSYKIFKFRNFLGKDHNVPQILAQLSGAAACKMIVNYYFYKKAALFNIRGGFLS